MCTILPEADNLALLELVEVENKYHCRNDFLINIYESYAAELGIKIMIPGTAVRDADRLHYGAWHLEISQSLNNYVFKLGMEV